ncbi:MAG: lytic transglycosylase domain-containing protein [Alicyclobacillus sp.]|nr:lytic transglycosylase domain-containing protein [Alicyclobacillus sp.]
MYPIGFEGQIVAAAHQNELDPLLVASVIRVESQFHEDDVSHAGAIGLMQLMPQTAQWIAVQMAAEGTPLPGGQAETETSQLASPALNIRLGTWYIRYLTEQFHGNTVAAIAAYNSGPQRVKGWLAAGTWDGKLAHITDIPVGETRHFVDRVFYNYSLYRRIYGKDPRWQVTASAADHAP